MIKLNNKNITYVALADSNNSTKGVKEIWYADSNNSVKLVYRRKDALIEGEDYEKYHLLNGYTDEGATLPTQGADINVGSISLDNKYFTIELGQISRNTIIYGQGLWFIPMWSYYANNQYIMQLQERNGNDNTVHNMSTPWTSSNVVTLDFQNNIASIGNTSFSISGVGYKFDGFHSTYWQNPRTVGKIKISDELHLVPCKLLKPVPKWLDANGIRRQVGECGMIDLVSGKFYGNVNSNGTFTVENYYERKEWLVGDGTAYIDTGHNTDERLDFETQVVCPDTNSGTHFFWFRYGAYDGDTVMVARTNNGTYRGYRVANNSNQVYWNNTAAVTEIKCYGNSIIINGTTYTVTNSYLLSKPFYLYYISLEQGTPTPSTSNNVKCSYFRFLDSNRNYIQNLIPCTLTMDLPASMDANNIARTKGTSGMWDLVSDRFYGNVANSGTFKAVNLAEGVDYEVHDWLVGDGSAYIDTRIKLTASDVITTKIIATTIPSGGSTDYYIVYGNNSGSADNTSCVLFGNSLMQFRPTKINNNIFQTQYNVDTEYEIVQSGTSIVINNQQVWQGSNTFESIDWNCLIFASVNTQLHNFNGKIAYFTISDKINIIPIKLLRSIPSKYDANGIARQAGECGMYDTVNDVFYGNVASSGSFTVSDDN